MPNSETLQQLLVAVAACEDKKGEDTRILALDPVDSGLADYFLITSASNDRQVQAISDEIEIQIKRKFGLYPRSVEGRQKSEWILLDYVDIVVHVFLSEKRAFYDIERLRKSAQTLSAEQLKSLLISKTRAMRSAKTKPSGAKLKSVKGEKLMSPTPKKPAAKKAAPKKAAPVKKTAAKPVAKKAAPAKKAAAKPAAKKAAPKVAPKAAPKAASKAAAKAKPAAKPAAKKAAMPAVKAKMPTPQNLMPPMTMAKMPTPQNLMPPMTMAKMPVSLAASAAKKLAAKKAPKPTV